MPRWLEAAAERVGFHLPFRGVVCTEAIHTISVQADRRAHIVTRRTLIFLETPRVGALRDVYALGPDEPVSSVIYESDDAVRLASEETDRGRLSVYWRPRDPVRLYTSYVHENGWMPATTFDDGAVCVEFECDMRTGALRFELVTSTPFDAAVVLKRPRWPRAMTKRRIVSRALSALKADELAGCMADRARVTFDVQTPHVGERYIVVAFRRCGLADWERRLRETSLLGRAKRLVARSAHA